MNQQRQEMLSALFDEQTNEFETRRLLKDMDEADIQQLRRYQLMRDVYQNKASSIHCTMDISAAVSAAIAEEPAPSISKEQGLLSRFKPLVGFATAASVAFVAVLAVQQWRYVDNASDSGFVADGNVSASQIPLTSSPGLSTASAVSALPAEKRVLVVEKQEPQSAAEQTVDSLQDGSDTSPLKEQ